MPKGDSWFPNLGNLVGGGALPQGRDTGGAGDQDQFYLLSSLLLVPTLLCVKDFYLDFTVKTVTRAGILDQLGK